MEIQKDSAKDIKLPLLSLHCMKTLSENVLWKNISQNIRRYESNKNAFMSENLQQTPKIVDGQHSIENISYLAELLRENSKRKQQKATETERGLDMNSALKLLLKQINCIMNDEINLALKNQHNVIIILGESSSIDMLLNWSTCSNSIPKQDMYTLVWILTLLLEQSIKDNNINSLAKRSTDVKLTVYWDKLGHSQQYNSYYRSMIQGIYILSVLRGHHANIFKFILKLFTHTKISTETSVIIIFKIDCMILYKQYLDSPKFTYELINWNKEHRRVLTKTNLFTRLLTSSRTIWSYISEQLPCVTNRKSNHNRDNKDFEHESTGQAYQIIPEFRPENQPLFIISCTNMPSTKADEFVQTSNTCLPDKLNHGDTIHIANISEDIEFAKNKVCNYWNSMMTKAMSEFETAKEIVSNFSEETFESIGLNLQSFGDTFLSHVTSESFRINFARQFRLTLLQTFFSYSVVF